ncbi:hypothetical protein FQZ97_866160 [compost metagenome]
MTLTPPLAATSAAACSHSHLEPIPQFPADPDMISDIPSLMVSSALAWTEIPAEAARKTQVREATFLLIFIVVTAM